MPRVSDYQHTLIPFLHLEMMQRFINGGGVELIPLKDPLGNRKPFIDALWRRAKLRVRCRNLAYRTCEEGRFLLYLQPDGRSYRIHVYGQDEYRVDYNAYGDIDAATIIFKYKRRTPGQREKDRWVRLYINKDVVYHHESDSQLRFDDWHPDKPSPTPESPPIPNVFGRVSCVEVLNPGKAGKDLGFSDFAGLESHLADHDLMTASILDNLEFFCRSPLVTNREAQEVEAALFEEGDRIQRGSSLQVNIPTPNEMNSPAWGSGFSAQPNRNPGLGSKRKRIKRVIGGVEKDEDLFEQLGINPVPPDLISYCDRYGDEIRKALGGTSEQGIETATETRIVYGGVEVTAREKREALFTYGLCELFEMAITAEEALYVESLKAGMNPPLGLEPAIDPMTGQSVDRTVTYRVAPVFVPTTRDILDRSIVGRNLQRLGVDVKETLKLSFPDKSEDELDQMVGAGGLPVEYLTDVMGVAREISQLSDPMNPGMPIIDPNTGQPLLYSLIPLITRALNYGEQFGTTDYADPDTLSAEQRAIAGAAVRAALERQLLQSGITDPDGLQRQRDQSALGLSQPLPTAGATVSTSEPTWYERAFPTFTNAGRAIAGFFRGGSGVG